VRRVGFWLGTVAFVAMLLAPPPVALNLAAWNTAALAVLMATWWFSEAVPVALTGSLPFLILPLLGIAEPEAVAARYMSPVLFLVLGGALLGLSLEKWGLHRRLALMVIARASREPSLLILALMAVTAFLSMWVNNSATTVMMLPIALATAGAVTGTLDRGDATPDQARFATAIVLAIAYAANIGGFATPIGTPVNLIAIGMLETLFEFKLGFVQWMSFGVPLVVLAIPLSWWLLVKVSCRFTLEPVRREAITAALGTIEPLTGPQRRVIAIVALTCAAWVFLPLLQRWIPALSDAGVAIAAALLLCVTPAGPGGAGPRSATLLDWTEARAAPWYLIVLLGGGLALADAVVRTGLSAAVADSLAGLGSWPLLPLMLAVAGLCILVTEGASNVATATIFMPIAASLALAGAHDAVLVALVAGMAASWGLANPAGTSSNALVFGTGRVSAPQMLKFGLLQDLGGAIVLSVGLWLMRDWLPLP